MLFLQLIIREPKSKGTNIPKTGIF